MEESRLFQIETSSGDGNLHELKQLFESGYTQLEIDVALENTIAYSQIEVAEYLLNLGANFSNYEYQGVYYAVHNDEIEGLKFAVRKGVDVNVNNGMLLNTSILTSINSKNIVITEWLLDNGADRSLLTNESIQLTKRYGSKALKELLKVS